MKSAGSPERGKKCSVVKERKGGDGSSASPRGESDEG